MFRNYLKVAFRNLAHQKVLAFINILGLSIGLACFSLFLLFAVNEFSYDRFNTNAANIYRVYERLEGVKGSEPRAEASGNTPLGPALKRDFADIENYARIQTPFDDKFIKVNNEVTRSKVNFADPQLFKMFSFKVLQGEANTALNDPANIVLTRTKAIQLFGKTDIVGQRADIKFEDKFEPFKVAAVIEDIPENSSLQFSILGSYDYLLSTAMFKPSVNDWNMTIGSETYVQLRKGSNLMNEPERFIQFRKKYYPNEEADLKQAGIWDGKGAYPVSFHLQPLREVHINAKIGGMASNIDPKYVWILISIAAGVLLIACINFTTLAIGRSAGRAKEVGVRKVMGGAKKQLVYQFLTESILLSICSALLGILIAQLLLPLFNQLAGRELSFSFSQFPELIWLLIALTLLTGILAGIYPAFVLSGFRPVEVLKSKIRLGGSNLFTKALVTVQFVLSIGLIISTVIILQQLKYMRSKDIGFNKENVIVVDAEGADTKRIYPLLKQELQSNNIISGVSACEIGMGANQGFMGTGFDNKGQTQGVIMYPVDTRFLDVMGMHLLAGRNFDPQLSTDTAGSIIVNEALLKDFKLTLQDAVGAQIMEKRFGSQDIPRTIIGVIKNFNFGPLSENVRSQMFFQPPSLEARRIYIRIKAGDPSKTIAAINAAWKDITPDLPFQYSFLDENFDQFYKNEERWSNIAGGAGAISIFLACLGLFGLAALAAVNRTKEIGIRKVLGAPVVSIVKLLSKDFLKLVAIAIVLATPLTWWLMNKWLQDYAYRITISWWIFVATGFVALLVALLTVCFQAIKAAITNPVNTLRTE